MSLALAPVRSTSVRTAPSLPDVPARPVSIAPRQAETAAPAPQAAPPVRTVRGIGYRFDRHADVSIRQASTPSPDLY